MPDHLREGLDVVFTGFNPSLRSGETGYHYANPTNRFWAVLYRSGLTARQYRPEENSTLLALGFGLTNIVARPTRSVEEITGDEYQAGRQILMDKIAHYRPKVVCYVGKGVYKVFSGRRKAVWGLQDEPVVAGVIDFVAPSTSGRVRLPVEAIITIFQQLKYYLETMP